MSIPVLGADMLELLLQDLKQGETTPPLGTSRPYVVDNSTRPRELSAAGTKVVPGTIENSFWP